MLGDSFPSSKDLSDYIFWCKNSLGLFSSKDEYEDIGMTTWLLLNLVTAQVPLDAWQRILCFLATPTMSTLPTLFVSIICPPSFSCLGPTRQ